MSIMLQPGKLVSLRGRDWIVLPSEDKDLLIIKPLGGSDEEIAGIYLPLAIPSDQPVDARFAPPEAADLGDIGTARLLFDSARLAFRNGAGPFRSLAKLSFRPRAYQMVPLIMALRQETVRLLIADDVGVVGIFPSAISACVSNAHDFRLFISFQSVSSFMSFIFLI